MKRINGTPNLSGFGFWDFQEALEKNIAHFIDTVLDQCPPKLHMAYGMTTGNAIRDGSSMYGFRPDDPLTVRLHIDCFCPDDGTSIQFDGSIGEMIDQVIKKNPTEETLQSIKIALLKEVEKIERAVENV